MSRTELQAAGGRLLREARAVRAAFPDPVALRAVMVSPLPAAAEPGDPPAAAFQTALRTLWDEVVLVRDGRAGTLVVLDDEAAAVERLLPGL